MVSGVSFFAASTGAAGASAFTAGAGRTAGVSAFVSAFVPAAAVIGVFAATLSSRLGSIFGELAIIAPPANPIVTAANTVPTPAKKELVLKAMSVSTFRKATRREIRCSRGLPFFPTRRPASSGTKLVGPDCD